MILIHCAHRGEARAFIQQLSLKRLSEEVLELYANDEVILLVCGEGIYASLERVSAVLGKYPKITEVINYGICGILNESKAELDHIYSIKSVYAMDEHGPVFQSYHSDKGLDCLTYHDRVTTSEVAAKLKPFAPLVDRELWAVARACSLHKIPFKSYKLTSDIAGTAECMDIKNKSDIYAQKLLEHYLTNFESVMISESKEYVTFKLPIHLTFQQKIIIQKLLNSIRIKYKISNEEIFERIATSKIIASEDLKDKAKASRIIQELQLLLNPLKQKINLALSLYASPVTAIGGSIKFDPSLEKMQFYISMPINDQTNLDKLQKSLQNINFEQKQ